MKHLVLYFTLLIFTPAITSAQTTAFHNDSLLAFRQAMSNPSFLSSAQGSVAPVDVPPCGGYTGMAVMGIGVGVPIALLGFYRLVWDVENSYYKGAGVAGASLVFIGLVSLVPAIKCRIDKRKAAQ